MYWYWSCFCPQFHHPHLKRKYPTEKKLQCITTDILELLIPKFGLNLIHSLGRDSPQTLDNYSVHQLPLLCVMILI